MISRQLEVFLWTGALEAQAEVLEYAKAAEQSVNRVSFKYSGSNLKEQNKSYYKVPPYTTNVIVHAVKWRRECTAVPPHLCFGEDNLQPSQQKLADIRT